VASSLSEHQTRQEQQDQIKQKQTHKKEKRKGQMKGRKLKETKRRHLPHICKESISLGLCSLGCYKSHENKKTINF
jgi:hypothetical protein